MIRVLKERLQESTSNLLQSISLVIDLGSFTSLRLAELIAVMDYQVKILLQQKNLKILEFAH